MTNNETADDAPKGEYDPIETAGPDSEADCVKRLWAAEVWQPADFERMLHMGEELVKARIHIAELEKKLEDGRGFVKALMDGPLQRMVAEKAELDAKIARLSQFVPGPSFKAFPDAGCVRLLRQLMVMREYSEILRNRINGFKP